MRDRRVLVAAGLGALLAVAVYWDSLPNGLAGDRRCTRSQTFQLHIPARVVTVANEIVRPKW